MCRLSLEKMGNHLIIFLVNIFNNTAFTDIYSCYMLIRRDLVPPENLKYYDMEPACPNVVGRFFR